MTREEALQILSERDRIGVNIINANDAETTKYNNDSVEALSMAIAALKAEPCEDAVSRQAAIDAVNDCGICIQKILDLPSAQPEIVRCKDCKHRDAEIGFCEGRGWPMQLVPDDGFCDKAESEG